MDATNLHVKQGFTEPIRSRKGVVFGPKLAEKREGKSINSTAKEMGLAPSTLMRLEKGEIGAGYDVTIKITQYYKCTVEDLRAIP